MKSSKRRNARRKQKSLIIDEVYWELVNMLGDCSRVYLRKNEIIIEPIDVYKMWDKITNYCSDVAIVNYLKQGVGPIEVEFVCAKKRKVLKMILSNEIDLLYLSPVFLLYERPHIEIEF